MSAELFEEWVRANPGAAILAAVLAGSILGAATAIINGRRR